MLLQRVLNIPFFFNIGDGCSAAIGDILAEHNLTFRRPVIVTGSTQTTDIGAEIQRSAAFRSARMIKVRDNTYAEVARLREALLATSSDLVVAVGGGKIQDVCKLASHEHGIPYVAVPTTLSNDGISSPVAVIRKDPLAPHESVGAHMPLGVIVDMEIVKGAPPDTLRAGVGDLVSNISALQDWQYAHRVRGERIDTFAVLLAHTATEMVVAFARQPSPEVSLFDHGFLTRLGEGLILSGLAMAVAGSSRPCSGSEHLISHALDRLLPRPRPHGLQVGVATLLMETIRGNDIKELEDLFAKLGIPTRFADLDIPDEVVEEALRIAPSMRPGRCTILNEDTIHRVVSGAIGEIHS